MECTVNRACSTPPSPTLQLHPRTQNLSFSFIFFFNDPAPTEIYTRKDTLSLHDALPISRTCCRWRSSPPDAATCSTSSAATSRSEEHTSELQSPFLISYAVFCLKKK